jgi:quercetin dioxygenase-like cupin family protein
MTNDRREFLMTGMTAMAAVALSEQLRAEGAGLRVERASVIAARSAEGAVQKPTSSAKPLAQRPTPAVNLDGWQMTASEVPYAPGQMSGRHRHPGFVIGYVLEGQYQFAVDDNAPQTLAQGQMFFESFDKPGEVHAVSGNASKTEPCRILAIVFHKKGDPVTIPG